MIKSINSKNAPLAIGPYSQATAVGDLVFVSGQIGLDAAGNLADGLEAQTNQVLMNLQAVLKEAGSDLSMVLKTTVYLKNMADFPKMNEIYAKYFKENKPARATVEVAALPKEALVEIEAIAIRKRDCCGKCNNNKK